MLVKIVHRSEYRYDAPVPYALQRLRLVPASGPGQTVRDWSLHIDGAREELHLRDHFDNDTRLVSVEGAPHVIAIEARGEVETRDTGGVLGPHRGVVPLWLFDQPTPLTAPGRAVRDLAESAGQGDDIERLHRLVALTAGRIAYTPGATDVETTAEQALALGAGVCQDHSHTVIAAARLMGFPARYVSGYLLIEDTTEQTATHAWAEVHVPALGWVGFDAPNGISPDERYVRVAVGRDYRDAMPLSGIRLGQSGERLSVGITVEHHTAMNTGSSTGEAQ